MSLTYDDIVSNLYQVSFAESSQELIYEYFYEIKKPTFVMEHKLFYPQGIFTEKGVINLYFFTETKVARVSFDDTISTQVWGLNQINTYKLVIHNFHNLELEIQLTTGDVLHFNNEKDTNIHRRDTFRNKILSIFDFLENRG